MTQEELFAKMTALAMQYEIHLDRIIPIIEKALRHREARKSAARTYYIENKDRLDKYHAKYRADNPDYRKRAAQRARRHK